MLLSPTTPATARLAFARLAWVAVVRPAWMRSTPWLLAIGVIASVLFTSQGLNPKDVVSAMHNSFLARCSLWAAWIALSAPVALVQLRDPKVQYLRSLPVARSTTWWLGWFSCVPMQVPWFALFLAADGSLSACAAASCSLAMHTAIAGLGSPVYALSLLGLVAAVACDLPPPVLLGLCLSAHVGWSLLRPLEGEPSTARMRLRLRGTAVLVLTCFTTVSLLRTRLASWQRGLLLWITGGLLAAGLLHNNEVTTMSQALPILLLAAPLPCALAVTPIAAQAYQVEKTLRWAVESTGHPARTRLFGTGLAGLALATPGVLLWTTIALSTLPHYQALRTLPLILFWNLVLAWTTALVVRRVSARNRQQDAESGSGLFPRAGAVAATGMALAWLGYEIALASAATALVLTTFGALRAERRREAS